MTHAEYCNYWAPARIAISGDALQASIKIASLFGIDNYQSGGWDRIELTPERVNLLKLLAGPHTSTIIKIIEARKSKQCTRSNLNADASNQST